MALRLDTTRINADAGAMPPPASPEAAMEEMALSPMVGRDSDAEVASLVPLAMTDSASGARPLPSLATARTLRDGVFLGAFAVHVLLALLVVSAVTNAQDDDSDAESSANAALEERTPATTPAQLSPESAGVALRSLCAVNALFAVGWLLLFAFSAKTRFLHASRVFSSAGLLVLALVLLTTDGARVFGVFAALALVADVAWMVETKSGLDFVAVLFELVADFALRHPSLALVTAGVLAVYTLWASWLCSTLALVAGSDVSPWSASLLFLYVHFYWTSNVLKNVLTVVVSGTTIIWYYRDDSSELSPGLELETVSDHERRVVGHFLKSALSSSLGSVCVGSLLCPLAHVIWNVVRWARRDESVLSRRLWFAAALRSERVEYFIRSYHKYSFVHIAGYGKAFYVAAHDAWQLIESRGVEAIVDDDPTSRLLLLGANGWASVMCVLCLSAFADSGHVVYFGLVSFVLCYTTLSLATNAVAAVIKTLFVCFAEHPSRLSQLNPLIYHRFVRLSELKSFRDHKAPSASGSDSDSTSSSFSRGSASRAIA
ncbi:hypothetical protein PybrP1_009709 [[Pythium] brassicae (nom. inval.)]|nr:hypothetical protein PybrP1_009709 [[Pythium] brassicae (nom. inval.)]